MAQFDVHRYKKGIFLVDVQSDLLDDLETRVVIPLRPLEPGGKPIRILEPIVEWSEGTYFLATSEIVTVGTRELGRKMGNISAMRNDILAATDMLFTGY